MDSKTRVQEVGRLINMLGIRQNAHLEKNVIQINAICSGGNEK
jgi:hypothetical protein